MRDMSDLWSHFNRNTAKETAGTENEEAYEFQPQRVLKDDLWLKIAETTPKPLGQWDEEETTGTTAFSLNVVKHMLRAAEASGTEQ